ncbi:hypothetical protein D917_03494 [Trichinella nativa]|uniref:MUN domain-containing protein n=1 Tax=Trichinella nativa TaxID=6335 RepID=A0A1Y3EDP7_9BILA|nr:hypothetical protein D917_03494 [Trichinella nativa]
MVTEAPMLVQSQSPPKQRPVTKAPSASHLGHSYIEFMRISLEQLRQLVTDELMNKHYLIVPHLNNYISQISIYSTFNNDNFKVWYSGQLQLINNWLTERHDRSLSAYQLTCLSYLMKKIYSDYELQGIDEEKLNLKSYASICKRLHLEETNASLSESSGRSRFSFI